MTTPKPIKKESNYSAKDVEFLKGLDPIRLRPAQFTRVNNPLHIIQEVIDNAVDEAQAGFATSLIFTIHSDNTFSVEDNGRGIPVDIHEGEGIPAIQGIFTSLYSGGKFKKNEDDSPYGVAGGLHGVGVSVTNALSSSLICEVTRDGYRWVIEFEDGNIVKPLTRLSKKTGSGTKVTVTPNLTHFKAPVPISEFMALIRGKAVLLKNIRVELNDLSVDPPTSTVFSYENGLEDLLVELNKGEPSVPPIVAEAVGDDTIFSHKEGASVAFSWYDEDPVGSSFVNMIPTPEHGTHVDGLRHVLFTAVKDFITHHGMGVKDLKIRSDDIFNNIGFVLSIKLLDPSFDNQTKDKLNSDAGFKIVERHVLPLVQAWMNTHPNEARIIATKTIENASIRAKKAKVSDKPKTSAISLPGKLADCSSKIPEDTEIFIVEGDSAGGSAKQGRFKEFQAILPAKGKSLNVWGKSVDRAMESDEIKIIASAIGISPHTLKTEDLDWSKLRYHKICILADADVDGFHIQTLLLTLFMAHFPQLIKKGYVYIACPPLYRVDTDSEGKSRPPKKLYAKDEAELANIEKLLKKEGYKSIKVGRFKGLGEMNPKELKETTLDPNFRTLVRVTMPSEFESEAINMFDNLMNSKQSKVDWRKEWISRKGGLVHE